MRVSYHTHSNFCDGKCAMEDYAKKAIEYNFGAMGFSSHAPIPFENDWTLKSDDLHEYIKTAYALKEKYKDKIQLYVGLEIDYIRGMDVSIPGELEYYLSSVHYTYCEQKGEYVAVDGPYEDIVTFIDRCYENNSKEYVLDYYKGVKEMILEREPTLIGHLDLVKKYNSQNRLFNENDKWYKDELKSILEVVKNIGTIVEINTGGMSRKYIDTTYPSKWIIKIMKDMNIPILLNSDAHKPEWLNTEYERTEKMLNECGYSTQRILYDGIWQDVPIG